MASIIKGSRDEKDCPLLSLEKISRWLIDSGFAFLGLRMCDSLSVFFGKIFSVLYHHEGLLFIQLKKRTKEEFLEDRCSFVDALAIFSGGNMAYECVLVMPTHKWNAASCKFERETDAHVTHNMSTDEFMSQCYEKPGIRAKLIC